MSKKHFSPSAFQPRTAGARKHAGFTLIELMVAMVIGMLLVLAMSTLLVNVSRSNNEMSKTNRLIENGRFALQLLEDDLSHAGFLGGYVPQFDNLSNPDVPVDFPSAVPDPCLAYADWTAQHRTNLIGIAVQGFEIPAAGPLPVCAAVVANPKANTDVLFVRHLERETRCDPAVAACPSCNPVVPACPAPTANELYFQSSYCGDALATGSAFALQPYVAANVAALFPLQMRNCTARAELRQFLSTLYYVRDFAVTAGDGIPTLMRSQFGPVMVGGAAILQHQPAQAMIEGIEGFRVEYGIDDRSRTGANVNFTEVINWSNPLTRRGATNRGDGVPDGAYVSCTTAAPCNAAQLANAVAVRIHVLARNLEPTPGYIDRKIYNLGATPLGPFNDAYKRHLFTQTIRLNNISSRRETPL